MHPDYYTHLNEQMHLGDHIHLVMSLLVQTDLIIASDDKAECLYQKDMHSTDASF